MNTNLESVCPLNSLKIFYYYIAACASFPINSIGLSYEVASV